MSNRKPLARRELSRLIAEQLETQAQDLGAHTTWIGRVGDSSLHNLHANFPADAFKHDGEARAMAQTIIDRAHANRHIYGAFDTIWHSQSIEIQISVLPTSN